jgi:hypothetical protein
MKTRTIFLKAMPAAVLIFGLVACASSTRLVTDWSDPAFRGETFKRILVLAVIRDDDQRHSYEQIFAERITRDGVTGIPGFSMMPNAKDYGSKPKIIEAVKKSGADAVLLANLISVTKRERQVPASVAYVPRFGYGHGYYGYYGRAYDTVYRPGYITVDTSVQLETTVYDSETEKMVWAGKTRSFNPGSAKDVVTENADLILASMKKAGLLP